METNETVRRTLSLFSESDCTFEAGANRPFLLDDGSVWLVQRGSVDVFCLRLTADGRLSGRTLVTRIEQGSYLVGTAATSGNGGAPPGVLQAVSRPDTTLCQLTPTTARDRLGKPRAHDAAARLIDGWVDAVCDGLITGPRPRDCSSIRQTSSVQLDREATVSSAAGVSWIAHREGRSRLLGHSELPMGAALIPCTRGAWFQTDGQVEVAVLNTRTVLATGDIWAALATFQSVVIQYALLRMEQAATAETARQQRRDLHRSQLLTGAFADLLAAYDASTTGSIGEMRNPSHTGAVSNSVGDASLAKACMLVGDNLGVRIAAAPTPDTGPAVDPVTATARVSGLRVRQVLLEEGWWQTDSGPLLARTEGDRGQWVALLPEAPGRYLLHGPSATDAPKRVTGAVARTLAPLAHSFYRPFPATELSFRTILQFGVRGCGRDMARAILLALAGGLLGLVTPIATGALFNTIIPSAERDQLWQVTLILLTCAIATGMFELGRRLALARVDGRLGATVQAAVWDRLLNLPLGFFRPFSAGDLAVRAMGIDTIRQTLSGATVTAALGGMFSLSNIGLLYYYGGNLAWWALLLLVAAVGATLSVGYVQLRLQRRIVPLTARTSGIVLQLLNGISKLRVAAAEGHAFAQWARLFSEQRRLQIRSRTASNSLAVFNTVFPILGILVIMAAATAGGTVAASIRTGDYLAFSAAFGACLAASVSLSTAAIQVLGLVPVYEAARPILDAAPEATDAKSDPGTLSGRIDVHHLTFSYRPDIPAALLDVSLAARPGEFVAIVGPSGSGKSTLLRLLLGFEQPDTGSVFFDGQDLAGVDVRAVRSQIGVVLQSGRIMAGELFTNIVGSGAHTLDDAWAAARMAGLDDDIRAMPMGMHTVVSEGANTLSGGQRQRLLIARAIVNRPRMLFFDEATSALDNRTQAIVSNSLAQLNATRIVIAHRLSTIEHADRILVMERGRIVQSGRYATLINRDGLFAELAKRQVT